MSLARAAVPVAVLGGLVFLLAGRWDLPFFWAVLALFGGYALAVGRFLDPELSKQREDPAATGPDRAYRLLLMVLLVAHLVVAALDVGRFHWSDTVPTGLRIAGVVGYAFSLAFVLWAMRVNRFFVPVVRVQEERGHRVVRTGPYGWVRHPGYLGSAVGSLFGAFAFGSWLAFVPLAGALAVLVARAGFEDRFLHASLDGYREYAREVRHRLVPGIW